MVVIRNNCMCLRYMQVCSGFCAHTLVATVRERVNVRNEMCVTCSGEVLSYSHEQMGGVWRTGVGKPATGLGTGHVRPVYFTGHMHAARRARIRHTHVPTVENFEFTTVTRITTK
jgi:hypothetical protein